MSRVGLEVSGFEGAQIPRHSLQRDENESFPDDSVNDGPSDERPLGKLEKSLFVLVSG